MIKISCPQPLSRRAKKFDIMKPIPPVLFKEFMFTFIESANTMQHKNL